MTSQYIESILGDREKILLETRQHGFILFQSILLEIVTSVIIITASAAIGFLVNPLGWLGMIVLVIPMFSMSRAILSWRNREFIVTNRRVIQTSGVLSKNVTDSSLEKVNDVMMEQSFWGRMFNYGDVEILTASEAGVNKFQFIRDPIRFKTAMLNAKEQMPADADSARVGRQDGSPTSYDIPGLIAQLNQLRQKGAITEDEFQQKKKDLLSKM